MKLKALRQFEDGVTRIKGKVFEVDDERGKELLADDRKLVEVVKDKKKEDK